MKLTNIVTVNGLIAGCLLGALAAYFVVHQLLIPGEAAMHISAGDFIVDGLRPYLGFLDNSAPLTLYLFALPAACARLWFIHPICIFNELIVVVMAAVALLLIAAAHGGTRRSRYRFFLTVIIAAAAAMIIYYLKEFGQLTMVYTLLMLPYFSERYLSGTERGAVSLSRIAFWRKTAAGGMAGIATLLDPLFVITLLAVEFVCFSSAARAGVVRLKTRYLAVELQAALASMVIILLVFALFAPQVMHEYVATVSQLNWCNFEFFNDILSYAEKSPDRRDLVYAFAFLVVLALPAAARCLLTRIFCAAAMTGFVYYICTGSLFTHQSFMMVALSFMAAALACSRYLHRFLRSYLQSLQGSLAIPERFRAAALVSAPILVFAAVAYKCSREIPPDLYFDLKPIGYYGNGIKSDLGFFSDSIERNSKVKDTVWIYSDQIRPGFPVLTQLHRKPGRLVWGFPFHILRVLPEIGSAAEIKKLSSFETNLKLRLCAELEGSSPPEMVLIEDGEIQDCFKTAKVWPIIEHNYTLLEPCTPLSRKEIAAHPRYEYLGFRVGFATFKLNRVLHQID